MVTGNGSVSGRVRLEVVNPRGVIEAKRVYPLAPRLTDLAGKRIGLYWNNKPGMDNFYPVFTELLKKKSPTATTTVLRGAFLITDEDARSWLPQIDAFVYGVGD
ncbi:MAG: hypothetical protein N2506_04060 [Dehalococcoidales bacterium]|nr:hypothetical protein [Dehalococcoidales bacterium]